MSAKQMLQVMICLIACAVSGCGKAQYEQLMQKRISDLRSGRAGVVRWEPYQSERFAYFCELPATPTVTANDQDGIESEKVEAPVGPTAYQLLYLKGDAQPLAQAANRVRQQYESAGYQFDEQADADVNSTAAVRLKFSNANSGSVAQVQVFVLPDNQSCAMSVIGSKLNQQEVNKFFDSFSST